MRRVGGILGFWVLQKMSQGEKDGVLWGPVNGGGR